MKIAKLKTSPTKLFWQAKSFSRGSSIIEVLIASAVITLSISASAMLIFSNQSVVLDSDAATDATYKAKKILEDARALALQDFNSPDLDSGLQTFSNEQIYGRKLNIIKTGCKIQAEAIVTWSTETLRPQFLDLSSEFVDTKEAYRQGGDCDGTIPGKWDNPITAVSTPIGGAGATDIDVDNYFIYLASNPSPAAKEDFYIYEFNPTTFALSGIGINVSKGIYAIDYAHDYVFAGSEDTDQEVLSIHVANHTAPSVVDVEALPDVTAAGVETRSVRYYDGKVYVGTNYLACPSCVPTRNNEFHIFTETSPGELGWSGRYKVNHNINDIVVRGNYAYLATSDDAGELHIYNISNPSNIQFVRKIDLSGNEDGLALYVSGNKLYLGRERTPAARKDFYIFTLTDPENPTEWTSINLGLNPGTTVEEIIVKGSLAFVGLDNPTAGLKILNVSTIPIVNHSTCTSLNFSENTSAMDMWGDFLFTANRSNDEIRIIRDQPSICS